MWNPANAQLPHGPIDAPASPADGDIMRIHAQGRRISRHFQSDYTVRQNSRDVEPFWKLVYDSSHEHAQCKTSNPVIKVIDYLQTPSCTTDTCPTEARPCSSSRGNSVTCLKIFVYALNGWIYHGKCSSVLQNVASCCMTWFSNFSAPGDNATIATKSDLHSSYGSRNRCGYDEKWHGSHGSPDSPAEISLCLLLLADIQAICKRRV